MNNSSHAKLNTDEFRMRKNAQPDVHIGSSQWETHIVERQTDEVESFEIVNFIFLQFNL